VRLRSLNAVCATKVVAPDWLRNIVGDAWLRPFRRIHSVTWNRGYSKDVLLEDDDLAILEGLTNLEQLSLNRTRVGDDALVHLEGLHLLKVLQLVDTEITDEGIKHLEKLTKLQRLDLWRTHVTKEGLKRLRALPKLHSVHAADARSDMW
jgi:hypothetical protein